MSPTWDPLQEINTEFQKLLGAPDPADIIPAHRGDPLMVWFLLGGKDVGKSTFLNALLGTEGPRRSPESVEGTQRFFAYVHESGLQELEARLQGLAIQVQFSPHTSPRHQHLCLIDSPDFDSRFEPHVHQVKEILSSGATDGAVLLASPEKYKNTQYWSAFERLSHTLSPRHILFVLNKADELGDYLEEARQDFTRTVLRRLPQAREHADRSEGPPEDTPGVYLIDARERTIDFSRLEQRLMRVLTPGEVHSAQHDNLRHARRSGAERIREHYRLDEVRAALRAAAAPERIDDLCEDAFPEPFFHTVAARLAYDRQIASAVREKIWSEHGGGLAGMTALHAACQWMGARNPFSGRRRDAETLQRGVAPDLVAMTRWGDEDLAPRLHRCQRATLAGLTPGPGDGMEPFLAPGANVQDTLVRRMQDLLSQPVGRPLSFGIRWALNLPVYLYLVFFLFLLFSPVFLLLKAWGVAHMPDVTGVLTLDNVKVAVLGFSGTYLMAVLFVVRKQRDRVHRETASLAHRFVLELKAYLRTEVERPLARFEQVFSLLEERLEHTQLSHG